MCIAQWNAPLCIKVLNDAIDSNLSSRNQSPMLIAEHEEAEILRHARLRTHAPQRAHGFSIRWLFAMLGWRDVCGRRATIRHAAKFNRLLTVILWSDYHLICWASPRHNTRGDHERHRACVF